MTFSIVGTFMKDDNILLFYYGLNINLTYCFIYG